MGGIFRAAEAERLGCPGQTRVHGCSRSIGPASSPPFHFSPLGRRLASNSSLLERRLKLGSVSRYSGDSGAREQQQ